MELDKYTDQDLQAEIERRKQVHAAQESARRHRAFLFIKKHPEMLDFAPTHSRTSCTDDDPSNFDRGCARCMILQIQASVYAHVDDWDLKVTFEKL